MKFADINKAFTVEVNKYLESGYHLNAATMGGSQGEIAHIDLTDGVEVMRVLLRNFTDGWDKQGVELVVGRVPEKETVLPDRDCERAIIWNNRLERIEVQRFYEVSGYGNPEKFYGTEADAQAVSELRLRRWGNRPSRQNKDMTSSETVRIVIPFIRRKLGIKNVDKKRVKVFRTPNNRYIVSYRGTGYRLNGQKC